ncbi:uncharacterized protein [Penaeus vannamei]|uniref:uncharacterized protein n=1 Tax=Penaeus vannamei TaxID=6689 RepID=UPI00387FA5A9
MRFIQVFGAHSRWIRQGAKFHATSTYHMKNNHHLNNTCILSFFWRNFTAALQCEVDATISDFEKQVEVFKNDSGLRLWFKADVSAVVTLKISVPGSQEQPESVDIPGGKTGIWHDLIVHNYKDFGLEWKALGSSKYADKYRHANTDKWDVTLHSDVIVVWSTCNISGISSQPDPTQRATTTPTACGEGRDERTTPPPSPSTPPSSKDGKPQEEECQGNQETLLYAVYGMAALCALLLLISLALCVRIFSVMRIKASVEGLATATYSAPRKPIDDDAIYEEINDNIPTAFLPPSLCQGLNHAAQRPQSEHDSENSLYGAVSQ